MGAAANIMPPGSWAWWHTLKVQILEYDRDTDTYLVHVNNEVGNKNIPACELRPDQDS